MVCFIGACGEPTEAESAEVVRSALKKGDIKAAIIESKSAVQRRPQSAEARFLLGKALFESGDPVGAVQELEKARELRFDDNQLLPLLARGVLLSTGLPSKVVERFADAKLSEPVAGADLKAQVGHAFFTLGKTDRADSEAVAALQLDAKNVHAQLLRALVAARRNAFDDALARVDAVIAQDPKNLSAWTLKGDLLYGAKLDRPGAEKSYRQALAISPSWVQAHLGLLTLFRHQDDKAKFRSQVGELKQAAPASLHAALFDTELALMDNDLPRARTGAQRLLVGAPRNSQVLSLAGQVALRTGAVDQARSHFAKAVQAQPEDAAPRLGLAAAMLRMGQAAEAISTLQPLLSSDRPSTDALQLAASAHLQNGDAAKADQYYERALKAMADDPRAKVALVLSKVAKGDSTALASLEAMAATDKDAVADMALVSHHLSTGDLKAALKYVDQLQRKLPEDPLPHLLRGRVLRQMNDNVGARASLERVLLADANHFAAISELATLDLAENKIDQLRARFEGLLKREPKNFRAMLTLADIHQRSGAKPEVVEGQILAAIAAAPFESTPRLALVEYRLGQRKSALALTAAQEA
ncbi:MAG TPA: XrtA/PEP-CTERM system TPR-repeat protein PrsT, partial [Rubrivivax sp.]|nr:XrtA/PEP-CTERM system TPR-repeat protein PrsT [Rubrivivax sp.]